MKNLFILNIFFLILLNSCGGEKIDGKPLTIGLRPVQDFYQDFVYQENSNEYFAVGAGAMSIGVVLFSKFGENAFMLFDTEKKLGPIQGDWNVEGRKIIFRVNGVTVAEGEGVQFPNRAGMIDLQLNNYDFLMSSKITLQKRFLRLDERPTQEMDPLFIFQNENNTAKGNCLIGEDPTGELSIVLRFYELEDEDISDLNDGNGKTFELINIKNRSRPVLYKNGSWNFEKGLLSLKFIDGTEFGEGKIKEFLGRPIVRFQSKPFALANSAKEFNLFLASKKDCSR